MNPKNYTINPRLTYLDLSRIDGYSIETIQDVVE